MAKLRTHSARSLNHVSTRAKAWLDATEREKDWSFQTMLQVAQHGFDIAADFCRIVDYPLNRLISQSERLQRDGVLLRVPSAFIKAIEQKADAIVVDNSRYTAKSRSKSGVMLIRIVLTLARSGDLSVLKRLSLPDKNAPEPVASQTRPDVPPIGRPSDVQVVVDGAPPAAVERSMDADARFRLALAVDDAPLSNTPVSIPANFGLDLDGLRDLTNSLLGSVAVRADVSILHEKSAPFSVDMDRALIAEYVISITSVADLDGDDLGTSSLDRQAKLIADNSDRISRIFPTAQCSMFPPDDKKLSSVKYDALVKTVRDKNVTLEGRSAKIFTYGTPLKIGQAFLRGSSLIVTGVSGVGKSTLLTKLMTDDAVIFEIGSNETESSPSRLRYRFDQLGDMLKKASRTPGRKVLIAHELFISPTTLYKLRIFDQFVFGGDLRQPGAARDLPYLFDFVQDIRGQSFVLPIIWRAKHPLSMMMINYFAYGSQYKICTRGVTDIKTYQFEVIECDDDPQTIAATMLVHTRKKLQEGRSVMIGAKDSDLVRSISAIVSSQNYERDHIQCRLLDDLQGREADALIIDLHDVATFVPRADDALKYLIMLLGRARFTTCFVLGKRNISSLDAALPIEVYVGVILRYRVRTAETKVIGRLGDQFQILSPDMQLVPIDEQSIALTSVPGGFAYLMLIRDRNSHNADALKASFCVIEAPAFFDANLNIDRECFAIRQLLDLNCSPKRDIYSISDIEEFCSRNRYRVYKRK